MLLQIIEKYRIDHRLYEFKDQISPDLFWYQEIGMPQSNFSVQKVVIVDENFLPILAEKRS